MYSRLLEPPKQSFFLFGPRGTGKSSWVKARFPEALYIDLLESDHYQELLASPQRLEKRLPQDFRDWVILDEVQKIPELLNEVHRLIEKKKLRFILTGSSARSLRKKGVNLLAGRALHRFLFPLTSKELQEDFDLKHSLQFGSLPSVYVQESPKEYLQSYVKTYLREEVLQEGLTRNLGAFARFLEAASFSQGAVLNLSQVAADCSVERKVVENYFSILEDLLLATTLPVFTRRAKRRMVKHQKFYFFDAGVFKTIRPMGPLDSAEEAEGPALETLILHELRALNHYRQLDFEIYYWRTSDDVEVDFILYGPKGIYAIEVKRAGRVREGDLRGLNLFLKDYPMAKGIFIYGGSEKLYEDKIQILPVKDFFANTSGFLL